MDFIPFDCEPVNGNNRTQTQVGIKRAVDDDNQVGHSSFLLLGIDTRIYCLCNLCKTIYVKLWP